MLKIMGKKIFTILPGIVLTGTVGQSFVNLYSHRKGTVIKKMINFDHQNVYFFVIRNVVLFKKIVYLPSVVLGW